MNKPSSEGLDLGGLEGFLGVQQHVGVGGRHQALLDLPDVGVVEAEPGASRGVVAHGRVVTHVQVTRVVLDERRSSTQSSNLQVFTHLENNGTAQKQEALTTTAYRWYKDSLRSGLDRYGPRSSFMENKTLVLSFT